MSPLTRSLSRRQLRWPLLLILLALAVTVAAVVQAQRAAAAQQRTTDRLLGEYAAFAVWSYGLEVQERLRQVAMHALGPVLHPYDHESPQWPGVEELPEYREGLLATCRCEPLFEPGTYLAWTLGADTLATLGARLPAPVQRALRDTIVRSARGGRHSPERLGLLALTRGDTTLLAAYGLMRLAPSGDTIVYAFTYDAASLQRGLAATAAGDGVLPATSTGGRPATDFLVLGVTTARDERVFESPGGDEVRRAARGERPPHAAVQQLGVPLGELRVAAALRPEAGALLVASPVPAPSRGTLAVLALLAAALTLLAVRQLRREAELARLRDDFVASVSHELRTPLAQMRLFLETLRLGRYRDEGQRRWLLGHVERETTRLGHLVENVLAFARLGRRDALVAGEPAVPTHVAHEVAETVEGFAPLAALHDARVALEADDALVALLHREAFRQLLLNLLDNAVKYGPRGQVVRVHVSQAARGDGAPLVRVTVRDEGPGIAADERERVWEGFYRGAAARARAAGGSGIGLALVREIARAHGGEARVAGEPHDGVPRGACLVVELPLHARATVEHRDDAPRPRAEAR